MISKRWCAFLLAFLLLLTMGCGGKAPKATVNEKKVVLIGEAYPVPEQKAAWEAVAAAFTAETGIQVELRRQGKWDEIPQALQAAKLAKEQIDLVIVGIGTVRSTLGPAGSVMDLTELMKGLEDRFPAGVLDSCRIGGHLWAIPYADASGTTCLYNKTMFEELGLVPPTTMEELAAVSQTIREKKNIQPMAFQGKDSWAWPMLFFDTYAQASGNQSIKNVEAFLMGERPFTGPQEQQALTLLKELYDKNILTKEVFDTDEDGMLATFAQGKSAMMFSGTWDYPVLNAMKPGFEVGGFEFPQVLAGAKPQHAFAVGDGAIEIPSFANPDNLENTMRFVEYILRPENAKKILTAGVHPLFEIVNGAVGEQDEVVRFLNEKSVPNSCMYLDWIWPAEVNDAVSFVIPGVISGEMTPQEAVQYIQKSLETIKTEKAYVYNWWDQWTQEDWAKVTPQKIPDVASFKK